MTKVYNYKLSSFEVCSVSTDTAEKTLIENVFSLNPKAGNVSFFSQQRRAVFVASEICDKHLEKDILIVGGGLSGTTCFFAMNALGHKKVTLIEAGGQLIWSQRNAAHRFAHPSLAEWPHPDGVFSSATDLPLMNWRAGSMDEVLGLIDEDPAYDSAYHFGDDHIHLHTTVTGLNRVTPTDKSSEKWKAEVKQYNIPGTSISKSPPPDYFDVVILATGFGKERGSPATNSEYWQFDFARRIREDARKFGPRQPVVVGGGDAALIDAARLCIGEKAEEYSCRLIFDLRKNRHKKFSKAQKATRNPCLSEIEKSILGSYKGGDMSACITPIPLNLPSINKINEERLRGKPHGQSEVVVVCEQDPLKNPGISAAVNLILFKQLQSSSEGQIATKWAEGRADFRNKNVTIDGNPCQFDDPNKTFIFRCGCDPDLPEIQGATGIIQVGNNTGSNPTSPEPLIDPALALEITYGILRKHKQYSGREKEEVNNQYRRDLVRQYAIDMFVLSEDEAKRMPFELEDSGKRIVITIPVSFRNNLERCKQIGGVDYTAFGVQLRYRDTDENPNCMHVFDSGDINTAGAASHA